MALQMIGRVHEITPVEVKNLANNTTIHERTLAIEIMRYNSYTGEPEFPDNPDTPAFQVVGEQRCADMDGFRIGDLVQVSFSLTGRKYTRKATGEDAYMNQVRAYRVEHYGQQSATPQAAPSAPAQSYNEAPPMPESAPAFEPQTNQNDGLPF